MKYFQALADIRNHYDDILRYFDSTKFGHQLLETLGIKHTEEDFILEEREVLRYLIGCQHMFVHDANATKPSLDVVERCFNRHLWFLENIHQCNAYNVNKHPSKLIQNQYKACRHYLFQFSLPAWYKKLPNEILTIDKKHSSILN
ncbi:hypothetical protein PP175_28730 (plasmid) [Aneurinibacillus sp. Ricciae_BoGa-3]|uniref:hypothetical protein n=1 Tax=Aneurinibacillus sp. Ricciae_BoGa-3 TaxID=3022697 RepID=UPI0023404271|nr:hypothetical protein [Aneurinibacillus sp. Ricciae_BoGa-3]WCK57176.1 hypothetical protein PP175_28730 [Aneurinibacillus sp. Ricciae_BoGa-3]